MFEDFEDQRVLMPLQKNESIILADGEQLCPQCNGRRAVTAYSSRKRKTVDILCGCCLGKGKLDWVEMVVGPKYDPYEESFMSSSLSASSSTISVISNSF